MDVDVIEAASIDIKVVFDYPIHILIRVLMNIKPLRDRSLFMAGGGGGIGFKSGGASKNF